MRFRCCSFRPEGVSKHGNAAVGINAGPTHRGHLTCVLRCNCIAIPNAVSCLLSCCCHRPTEAAHDDTKEMLAPVVFGFPQDFTPGNAFVIKL